MTDEKSFEMTGEAIKMIIIIFLVIYIFTSWVQGSINPLDWGINEDSVGLSDVHNYTEFHNNNDEEYSNIGDLKDTIYYIKAETSSKLKRPKLTKSNPRIEFPKSDDYYVHKKFALNFKNNDGDTVGIKNLYIKFKIEKKILEEKNIRPQWIRLAFWKRGKWEYGGKMLRQEEDIYYYEAGVPYSDSYAIIAYK